MSLPNQNKELMERHDLTLAFTKVHVFDLYPRKASCLRFMFRLLRRLPSCDLELMVALTPTIPRSSLDTLFAAEILGLTISMVAITKRKRLRYLRHIFR
ncbi:hypothetical protein B296_00026085 [Ensete ventricosum]|uniref:Uncharacterized protein n=1 Tax=Ensete ventricosum TaxID=4639 RepID=A0A427AP71_ENSVE|nr:hypothetical protein B296_00026085 [Ensete ventricosum]